MRISKITLISIFILLLTAGAGFAAVAYELLSNTNGKILFSENKPANVLILGSDSRTESYSGRSDSIMVVRVDPRKKTIKMVSFPRDARVKIPGRGFNKINAAFAYGGPELAVKAVEQFAGIKIDGYVATNFRGFIKSVNQLNGLKFDLEKAIHDRQAGPFLDAGPQTMDGLEALALARSRKAVKNGDFGRAANHQKMIKAFLVQEKDSDNKSLAVKAISILPNVKTDLPLVRLLSLGFSAMNIDNQKIDGVVLEGSSKMVGGASVIMLDSQFAKQAFEKF